MATSIPSAAEHNTRITSIKMEVDTREHVQEKGRVTQQSSSPKLEHENTESVAYLQKTISDPANAIVQQQIQGNTAKMLVMLTTGEQRLITFNLPNEDCTVHDLLDQVRAVLGKVNITFSGETEVSLVDDPALGINYIVEDIKHLNEQINQAKIKQLQKQHIEKQRFQQNNTQRQHSNTLQHGQSPLHNPTRRFINPVPQRTQPILISPQQIQKPSMATSIPSAAEHNIPTSIEIKVDTPEHVQEEGHVTQQFSSPRLEHKNTEGFVAYLQKFISYINLRIGFNFDT